MIGKIVCLVRSDIQINAHMTHGVFLTEADARLYVEQELHGTVGIQPGEYMILDIKVVRTP